MTNRKLRQALDNNDELFDWARCAGIDESVIQDANDAMATLFYAIPCNDDVIPSE